MLPRLKKIVSIRRTGRDGKPVSRVTADIRVHSNMSVLESYEDTMDGLELAPPASAACWTENHGAGGGLPVTLRPGAWRRRAVPVFSAADFVNPFAYTLSVVRDGARQAESADLPETFNYLIGLRVASRRRIDGVLAMIRHGRPESTVPDPLARPRGNGPPGAGSMVHP